MIRYKLPDGTEVTDLATAPNGAVRRMWIEHPTLGPIYIEHGKLAEIIRPTWADAPVVMIGDEAWTHTVKQVENESRERWYNPRYGYLTADDLIQHADGEPIMPFVPAPAVDAPELPWRPKHWKGGGDPEISLVSDEIRLRNGFSWIQIPMAEAVRAACAILRAAREAETE